jgi:hypothetical protein
LLAAGVAILGIGGLEESFIACSRQAEPNETWALSLLLFVGSSVHLLANKAKPD